jgi:hypothetical protein
MRNDYVDVTLVIDKSGSMQPLTKDTIGGVNNLLAEQRRQEGEARLTMIQFDSRVKFVHTGVNVKNIPDLNEDTYRPSGNTALVDAMAHGIISTGNRLRDMRPEDRPAKVIFVVITDGQENSSNEFNKGQLRQMVREQSNVYNWEFVYLGANVDAFSEAGNLGISYVNAANYGANAKGIGSTYTVVGEKLRSLRRECFVGNVSEASMAFTADEQKKLQDTVDSKTS